MTDPNFDTSKPTVLFFYDKGQSEKSSLVKKVKDAYLDNGKFNFVIVTSNTFFYNVMVIKKSKFSFMSSIIFF